MQEHRMDREAQESRNLIVIHIPSGQRKVQLSLPTPLRAYGWRRSIAPLICNLGARWRQEVNFTLRLLYFRERNLVAILRGAGSTPEPVWGFWRWKNLLLVPGFEHLSVLFDIILTSHTKHIQWKCLIIGVAKKWEKPLKLFYVAQKQAGLITKITLCLWIYVSDRTELHFITHSSCNASTSYLSDRLICWGRYVDTKGNIKQHQQDTQCRQITQHQHWHRPRGPATLFTEQFWRCNNVYLTSICSTFLFLSLWIPVTFSLLLPFDSTTPKQFRSTYTRFKLQQIPFHSHRHVYT
jgi:hypothetical protein